MWQTTKLQSGHAEGLTKNNYSSVFRGVYNYAQVAVKRIPREFVENKDKITALLTRLEHKNVLNILTIDDDVTRLSQSGLILGSILESNLPLSDYYVVMEMCSATLENYCEKEYEGPMPSELDALLQITSGLRYIHSKGLVHGNLKPSNILISAVEPIQMKLSDFGLIYEKVVRERFSTDGEKNSRPFNRGRYWMAYELIVQLLKEEGQNHIQAAISSDIFASGCLFFFYLTRGVHLYGQPSVIVFNIVEGNLVNLELLPEDHFARTIIVKMVTKQHDKRISLKQVHEELLFAHRHAVNNDRYSPLQTILTMSWDESILLGRGAFAVVFQGSLGKKKIAVKQIRKEYWNPEFQDREENIMKLLDHPNVLKLYSVVQNQTSKYFGLEFCGGTLHEYGTNKYTGLMPSEAEGVYQMVSGLEYIHSQSLVHRDIKPSNVLISQTKPVQLKWSDFGLSKLVNESGTFTQSDIKGTFDWMAPEVLGEINRIATASDNDHDDSFNRVFIRGTNLSDIFSAGCVLFFFLKKCHPFGSRVFRASKVTKGKPTELKRLSENHFAYELIAKMIVRNPDERMKLASILNKLSPILIPKPNEDESNYIPGMRSSTHCGNVRYSPENKLGEGAFGSVFSGFYKGEKVAVKIIPMSEIANCEHEVDVQRKLQHENVLKLLEVIDEGDAVTGSRFIVLELCAGTLEQLINKKYTGPMPTDREVLYQIACGVQYIHKMKLVHRDIKPDNILISRTDPVVMKVSDFGLSKPTTINKTSSHSGMRTQYWMAPEVLKLVETNQEDWIDVQGSVQSDIFGSGCVFFYFIKRGIHPFGEGVRVMKNIIEDNPINMKELPKEHFAYDLIENMIKNKKEERIALTNVIEQLENTNSDETISSSEESATDSRAVQIPRDSSALFDARIDPTEVIKKLEEPIRENTNSANESIPLSEELATGSLTVRVLRESALFDDRLLEGHIKFTWVFLTIIFAILYPMLIYPAPKPSPLSHWRIEQDSEQDSEFKWNAMERSFPQLPGFRWSRFHPSEPVLACGSMGSSPVILLKGASGSVPLSNWKIEQEFKRQTQSGITELEWNVDGTQLAAGCVDGTVIVWSYPSGRVIFEEKKHSKKVDLIAWNPFRQDVLATRHGLWWGKELLFWNSRGENGDAEKANHFLTLDPDKYIGSVTWISSNQIAIGLFSGWIEIREIDEDEGTSRVVKQFGHREGYFFEPIFDLQWNERTKYLASSWDDESIKIWSMDSDRPVHTMDVHSRCLSLAWRRNVKTDNVGGIESARKDKENFILACGLHDGSIVMWNPLEEEEGNRKRILPQKHLDEVLSLSFSPDGQFLASADWYKELIIWSTQTWLPVFACKIAGYDLSWMSTDSFSVPANTLAVISKDKIRVIEQSSVE